MTLIFTIAFPRAHPAAIRQAVEAARDVAGTRVSDPKPEWLSATSPPVVELPEARDLLSDEGEGDDGTWNFSEEGRTRIARALEVLCEAAHDLMVVRAAEAESPASETEALTIDALSRLVLDNRLGRRTVYEVRRH